MRKLHFLFVLLFLAFVISVSAQTEEVEDDEIITVESNLVVMNATITDKKGEPVFGLKEEQFEVYDDGKLQKLAFFKAQETPFAAVILLDSSGSMENQISVARSAAIKFLENLRFDDNAAIYSFDTTIKMVQDFSNSRDIAYQIFDLKADGWTVLNDAIYKAAQVLSNRPEKRRAIVVLSDGADTRSGRSASKALKAAQQSNATIYTIDMSSISSGGKQKMQNTATLKKFAKETGGVFVATRGGVEMREAFQNIVKELGVQYTLGFYPADEKKDGKFHELNLRIARPNLNIRTRKGYEAPKEKR